MDYSRWADVELESLRREDRFRTLRSFDAFGPSGRLDGTRTGDGPVTSFASNDYLGLSTHPRVMAAAHEAIDRWGTGSTASRLVVGTRPAHVDLEARLAEWKHAEAAVVLPSGYAANLATITALGGPDCLVVSDELNHASIIDGCRLSRSPIAVATHNDPDHVDSLLAASDAPRSIVVTDAVFSMDGDEAPIAALAEVCARHGALFVLDQAHAVLGPDIDALRFTDGLDVVHVVTLSKALGSMGGAICAPRPLVELVVNRARSLIFSTGLSPADAAAASAALEVWQGPEGAELVGHLRRLVERVAPGHPSPIVPVIVGDENVALGVSEQLLEVGILVPAIRPPTVAVGTSRLRVALSAAHTEVMVDELATTLESILAERGLGPAFPGAEPAGVPARTDG
ncbi:MAG: aminotransferase class I/II-fold pyridoxal phosphate-dependent enzyme [Microthrixaceae bacterium]